MLTRKEKKGKSLEVQIWISWKCFKWWICSHNHKNNRTKMQCSINGNPAVTNSPEFSINRNGTSLGVKMF